MAGASLITDPKPVATPAVPAAPPEDEPLLLRPSRELFAVPAAKALAASPGAAATPAQVQPPGDGTPAGAPAASSTSWLLAGTAVLATLGWLVERKRRRLLETEKDSVLWADVQPPGASIVTEAHGLEDILPDNSPSPAEAARAIFVTAIGETISRREATLIDLHQLHAKLARRRKRGDNVAAVLLLQEHLVDFRYTSPWVFLELFDLYRLLDRQKEWDIARLAFRKRFGQNAPEWNAASTARAELTDDPQLAEALANHWPYREARMFVVRWMLGEHEMRQKASGPPMLGLGVYRDMMLLDGLLDEVMDARTVPADSLL